MKEKKKITLKEIGLKNLILLCVAGLILIILSVPDILSFTNKKQNKHDSTSSDYSINETGNIQSIDSKNSKEYVEQLEERLKNILKKVEGIGEVEVMITIKASKEQVILKDAPYSQESVNETDNQGGSRISSQLEKEEETVLVQPENGGTLPYVIKELEPEIEGVVVIATGGDNSFIISEINSAIEALFGVPVHKIKVMKMSVNGIEP